MAAKADLNVKNDQTITARMGAVESGSTSIVWMLIEAGASDTSQVVRGYILK